MTTRGPAGDAAWMSDFTVSASEFRALYERLRRASEQGPADRLGRAEQHLVGGGGGGRQRCLARSDGVAGSADSDLGGARQPRSRRSPDDVLGGRPGPRLRVVLRHRPAGDEHPRQRRQPHRRALPCDVRRKALQRHRRGHRDRGRERPSSPSTSSARGSSAAACCSTSRVCAGCRGWSLVTT